MRSDFVAFILTHGRPDRVYTYVTLKRSGYTGRIVLVVDDEDPKREAYQQAFPGEVVVFSRAKAMEITDDGDNFERRGVVYARNICWDLARSLGFKHFIVLDDDYNSGFYLRFDSRLRYGNTPRIARSLDAIFEALLEFYLSTPALTVAFSQGGDHIGGNAGGDQVPRLKRKAMNAFVCTVDRPFAFFGRTNEDVNAYVTLSRRGGLFFTVMQAQVNQLATQSNPGGLTELYLDSGTYVKSFYTVMYAPSCARVGVLGDPRSPSFRLHHVIDWRRAAPKMLRESHRKELTRVC